MVAIHYEEGNNFSPYWRNYCIINGIPFKEVNCYDNNIFEQLEGCSYLLWHVNNLNSKDHVFAKYLIKSVECSGIKVFPNDRTLWHFDDKVAQKYLFESFGLPMVNTMIFFDKTTAVEWIDQTSFPKVFKLRKGSGSKGVWLAENKSKAKRLVRISFGTGFKTISVFFLLKERIRKFKIGQESLLGIGKGVARLFIGTNYINTSPREKGYAYFQDFIPNNDFDIRVIVIGDKAFAIKRLVRKGDFRASGSGHIIYDRDQIDLNCVELAFKANTKIGGQCIAFDFVFDENRKPLIVEISYGYNPKVYRECEGYWDENLNWYPEIIQPEYWMIENLLNSQDGQGCDNK